MIYNGVEITNVTDNTYYSLEIRRVVHDPSKFHPILIEKNIEFFM